jgi:hypothetical protein
MVFGPIEEYTIDDSMLRSTFMHGMARNRIFSPLDIPGCALWLEADRGITLDGSNKVSAWADQSGNGRHFINVTTSLRPLLSLNKIGGRPAVLWDGTSNVNLYHNNSNILRNVTGWTIFSVVKTDDISSKRPIFSAGNNDCSNARAMLLECYASSHMMGAGQRLDNDTRGQVELGTANTNPHILTLTGDYTNRALTLYENGRSVGQNPNWLTVGSSSDTNSLQIYAGRLPWGYFFYGGISVIAVYPYVVSLTDRQQFHNSYGLKYGITVA